MSQRTELVHGCSWELKQVMKGSRCPCSGISGSRLSDQHSGNGSSFVMEATCKGCHPQRLSG